MASTDAKPVPQKNVAYRVTFPILDADGDLVTGATGLDSEISKDGGTFADCTNEATEIASGSGVYYLDLTSTEMNADTVAIIVKTSTSGAKTTTLVMYPQENGDIKVDVQSYGGTAGTFSGGRPEVNASHAAGTAWNSGAIGAATLATDTLTAAKIAADAIGASELATDAVTEIVTAVWAATTRILTANTNLNDLSAAGVRSAIGLASANLDTQLSGINSKTTNLPPDPADASDIAASFSSVSAMLTTIAGYIDTEVAAIKAKTDQLAFTTANRVDAQVFGIQANAITANSIAADAITDAKVASDVTIASVTGAVGSVTGDVGGNVTGSVGSLAAQAKADVNAEIVDALVTDTYSEPGQGSPAATSSLKDKIGYLFKAWRNKTTQTDGVYSLYADDAATVDQKANTADDGTTFTRTEVSTGP